MVEYFNNTGDYAIYIPGEVLRNTSLTPMAKILYGEILLLSRKKGYCYASNNFFANKYECCHQSIRNWIIELKSENLVETQIIPKSRNNSIRKIKIIGGLPPNFIIKGTPKKLVQNNTSRNIQGENNFPQNILDIDHRLKEI